jgi:1-deoxy-D-xylulose-5-phosphate synthase
LEILPHINSPADVKGLSPEQLDKLCAELREKIIASVSQSGGHLASNLGAVELTVALHRVYDPERDRIVFDVGHQCYAHKMLTGRRDEFDTLRSFGGLSGFPKPCESRADACISGHASCSISNALGMARARTLLGESYDVAAVIGDGALTGGLAYEGLADCGESGEPIVVILNDNGMSIASNVGGMARLLSRLRIRPQYIRLKRFYHRTIGRVKWLYRPLHGFKEWVKDLIMPDNMFEDMGFYYLGPIDGHDEKTLERVIEYARQMRVPALVHVITVKGKGYPYAETEPDVYHGVGPFDPKTGARISENESFSSVFGETLERMAAEDERIVAVTAAMESGTGLRGFALRYPKRFFDVGIAEGHAVSMCAGMAKQGLRPAFAVYSSFLQRGYDMLIHDVALSSLPVVLGVDRAGLVGADGETHQGCFDVGYLSTVPGMRIYAPSSYAELRTMLRLAFSGEGPAAVRYPRGGEGEYQADCGGESETVLREGTDVTIVSYGIMINQALSAARELAALGVSAGVVKLGRLDGENFPAVLAEAKKTRRVITVEDVCASGSAGERVLAFLEQDGVSLLGARRLDLGSGIVTHGSVSRLMAEYGIDSAAIVSAARELMEGRNEKGKA